MDDDKDTGVLSSLDRDLNPLSPEVIACQATINIGTIGHVAHGKSTLVKAISGVQTVRFKAELKANKTIKLGYANAKIYKCEDENCPRPMCYKACGSGRKDEPFCDAPGYKHARMRLVRHVSFVDCPGHDEQMVTMLNGAAIMDGALLLIAANEPFPRPQTMEHLVAIDYMRLEDVIVVQNKIDLIQKEDAIKQSQEIHKYLQNTTAQGAPVVPVSAQMGCNIEVLCEYLVTKIPIPVRDFVSPATMRLVRSFDVNKPGAGPKELQGGVVGGSILKGVLKLNDIVEIRPGNIITDKKTGDVKGYSPIRTRIASLFAERNELKFAVPGGLIGVGTTMDPTLTRGDRLVGYLLGEPGSLPNVYSLLEVKVHLLRRIVGKKANVADEKEERTIPKLVKGEVLMLNIASMPTKARVIAVKHNRAKLKLKRHVCASTEDKVALSRGQPKNWRLIGWGEIVGGDALELLNI